jgi:hypothetical protein
VPPEDEEEEEAECNAAQLARREMIQHLRRTYSESAGDGEIRICVCVYIST